jgi:ribonuclease HI
LSFIKVYTDGASKGNPGPAGIGAIIYDENDFIISSCREYLGTATNNQAEYKALIKSAGLVKELIESGDRIIDRIEFYSDSDLMVNQVNFDFQVKEPELALLNHKFHVKMKKLAKPFTISYIPREKNKAADRLANEAISANK